MNGEKDGIYEGLSRDVEKRRSIYRDYVESGEVDKRDEGRYFKEGAYGSREFIKEMKKKGLKSIWSHGGRPRERGV